MPADSDLLKFIEAARTQGASDVVLVGLLKGRGWPEDEIYRALGTRFVNRASGLGKSPPFPTTPIHAKSACLGDPG